jgi:integrase
VIEEYLTIAAPNYYALSTTYTVRVSLAKFFRFVVAEGGISTLSEIRPSIITRFIAAERVRGLTSRNFVGHLATFFNWLIAEERYDRANPVVARIHSQRGAPAAPRPYHDRDLEMIWKLVEASGRPELILAFAIGEECGLRIGEVCNIRLSDLDQASQTIFVRLPTKNKKVRTVQYHEKVRAGLNLWFAERDPDCEHDNLLHNNARSPFQTGLLDYWFKKLLKEEDEPACSFHFHRLRHTWATRLMNNGMELAVLKALGGWETWNSMQRYIKVLDSTVRRQYEESYQKLQENDRPGPEEVFSLNDFAALNAGCATSPARA